jgi:hypothetical protein
VSSKIKIVSYSLLFLLFITLVALFVFLKFFPPLPSSEIDSDTSDASNKQQLQKAKELFKVPVYPGSIRAYESDVESEFLAVWEINKPVSLVTNWYLNTLSDGDWEIENFPIDPANENIQNFQVRDDMWRTFYVVEKDPDSEKTVISVTREYAPRD